MIVPVMLSHVNDPKKEILVYAMLDTQSDTSFITDKTAGDLNLEGKDTSLILSTMTTTDRTVSCKRYEELRVRGVYHDQVINLSMVYSRRTIPANRDHIPKTGMIDGWPHLEPLRNHLMPKSNCEVGLLIGYDCPKALAPKEILQSPVIVNGPFGMKTSLGWGIVGIVGYGPDFQTDQIGFSHRILANPVTGSQIVHPIEN